MPEDFLLSQHVYFLLDKLVDLLDFCLYVNYITGRKGPKIIYSWANLKTKNLL